MIAAMAALEGLNLSVGPRFKTLFAAASDVLHLGRIPCWPGMEAVFDVPVSFAAVGSSEERERVGPALVRGRISPVFPESEVRLSLLLLLLLGDGR